MVEVVNRAGRVQSVARALAIVDIVADRRTPPRAQEIATELGLHLTTTVHLLNTLVDAGYLEKHGRAYVLATSKILSLHDRISAGVRPSPRAVAALHQVSDETGETSNISVWTGDDVILAANVEGRHAVRVAALQVGTRGDIHARASGKCLLAFGPPARLDRYLLTHRLRSRTENTITDEEALRAELVEVQRLGYAMDAEEYTEGIYGAAVPLPEGDEWPTVALSVMAPAGRFTRNKDDLVAALYRATGE